MTPQEAISKIELAKKLEDVLDVNNFKASFNEISKLIHPDICKLTGAAEAMSKMGSWKEFFENGKEFKDDISTYRGNGYSLHMNKSDEPNFGWSLENYRLFMELKNNADKNFQKYLPKEMKLLVDGSVEIVFDKRSIPLSGLQLPQEHVNWILNRLLEYSTYLASLGFSHCGLTPESVFIVPETHGIQVCSFYHLSRLGEKIGTISGKYSHWYPAEVFIDKLATQQIDIEMSKKMAAYLLGDTSGSGIRLRKTHNEDFVNFIVNQNQETSLEVLSSYRELLAKNFKKEFHNLDI